MPLFAVLFEDHAARADEIRRQTLPAHLEFLARHADRIEAAGPLREAGAPAGGLWLVRADSAASVEQLIHDDPFWPTGLRKSVRILDWHQVFAAGKRV